MIPCERHPRIEAVAKRGFDSKWLCRDCFEKDGDFDRRGLMKDKRIKR